MENLKRLLLQLSSLLYVFLQAVILPAPEAPSEALNQKYNAFKECIADIDIEMGVAGRRPSEPATDIEMGGAAPAPQASNSRDKKRKPDDTELKKSVRERKDERSTENMRRSILNTLNGLYSGSTHTAVTLRNILLTALVQEGEDTNGRTKPVNKVLCPSTHAMLVFWHSPYYVLTSWV